MIWTIVVAIGAAAILLSGGYNVLERVSIGLVFTFTLITIACTVLLQWTGYAVTWDDIRSGLEFRIFPNNLMTGLAASTIVMTALAAYAGTGIGHYEMITYTYWCVEKGYARNAGECVPGDDWPRRARGWVKVMYTDVFLTMIVYTVSTLCFYFLGAAILNEKQIDPDAKQTLTTLQEMYTSVIHEFSTGALASWAATGFIVGAFFVLFSTVLAGAAGGCEALDRRVLRDAAHRSGRLSGQAEVDPHPDLRVAGHRHHDVFDVHQPAADADDRQPGFGRLLSRPGTGDDLAETPTGGQADSPVKTDDDLPVDLRTGPGSDFARRRDLRPGTEEWLVAVAGLAAGLATSGRKTRAAVSVGSISVDRMCSRDIIG